jgi:hypothetical protein
MQLRWLNVCRLRRLRTQVNLSDDELEYAGAGLAAPSGHSGTDDDEVRGFGRP